MPLHRWRPDVEPGHRGLLGAASPPSRLWEHPVTRCGLLLPAARLIRAMTAPAGWSSVQPDVRTCRCRRSRVVRASRPRYPGCRKQPNWCAEYQVLRPARCWSKTRRPMSLLGDVQPDPVPSTNLCMENVHIHVIDVSVCSLSNDFRRCLAPLNRGSVAGPASCSGRRSRSCWTSRRRRPGRARGVGDVVEVAVVVGVVEVHRRRHDAVADRQQAGDRLDRAPGGDQVAGHALGARDRHAYARGRRGRA